MLIGGAQGLSRVGVLAMLDLVQESVGERRVLGEDGGGKQVEAADGILELLLVEPVDVGGRLELDSAAFEDLVLGFMEVQVDHLLVLGRGVGGQVAGVAAALLPVLSAPVGDGARERAVGCGGELDGPFASDLDAGDVD